MPAGQHPPFYATIGQRYRDESHPKLKAPDPDGVYGIAAPDQKTARERTFTALGVHFGSVYPWDSQAVTRFYPHGTVGLDEADGTVLEYHAHQAHQEGDNAS